MDTPYTDAYRKHRSTRKAAAALNMPESTFRFRLKKETGGGCPPLPSETPIAIQDMPEEIIDDTFYARAVREHGSIRKAAGAINMPESTFRLRLKEEKADSKIARAINPEDARRRSGKAVYVVTAAQNDTKVHERFWANLVAYADHRDARLIVIPISYTQPGMNLIPKRWADEVQPYLTNERIRLHDEVLVCGEMDIIPTAAQPLSSLSSYSGEPWGIYPHTKIRLESVATPKGQPAKQNMTTGACTVPHYIQAKTGLKAVFHHSYGAVIVEVDYDTGRFWCRHVSADERGAFYDLDLYVDNGRVRRVPEDSISALIMGDIHIEKIDNEAFSDTVDFVKMFPPERVIIHDLIDFRARNHHNQKSVAHKFHTHMNGEDSVEKCFEDALDFLRWFNARYDVIVAPSNHHDAFRRWLEESNFKDDPENAEFYLAEMARYLRAVKKAEYPEDVDPFVLTLKAMSGSGDLDGVRFLGWDGTCKVHDIEVGYHGHLGANGARGTPRSMSKLPSKTFTAHTHSATIIDGNYCVGTMSRLDMGYNKGPSSWSHTNGIIYANGHRCLLTRSPGGGYCMAQPG